ncbi:hypothetical protein HDV00_007565, partial [Rhizophlyctis rosea]
PGRRRGRGGGARRCEARARPCPAGRGPPGGGLHYSPGGGAGVGGAALDDEIDSWRKGRSGGGESGRSRSAGGAREHPPPHEQPQIPIPNPYGSRPPPSHPPPKLTTHIPYHPSESSPRSSILWNNPPPPIQTVPQSSLVARGRSAEERGDEEEFSGVGMMTAPIVGGAPVAPIRQHSAHPEVRRMIERNNSGSSNASSVGSSSRVVPGSMADRWNRVPVPSPVSPVSPSGGVPLPVQAVPVPPAVGARSASLAVGGGGGGSGSVGGGVGGGMFRSGAGDDEEDDDDEVQVVGEEDWEGYEVEGGTLGRRRGSEG